MRIFTTSAALLAVAVSSATVAQAQTPANAPQRDAINEAAVRQANQAAQAKESQIVQQLRGIEALLANEQKLLEQRMAYAAQLRAKGLQEENADYLRKAEAVERQAVALYQQRINQVERLHQQLSDPNAEGAATQQPPRAQQPARVQQPRRIQQPAAARPAASKVERSSGEDRDTSAPAAKSSRRSWWPFGR